MPELAAVRHQRSAYSDIVVVDWSMGSVCNYRCSYCPAETHAGTIPFFPIEDVLAFSRRIAAHYRALGKQTCFLYTGGEVTVYRDLLPLVRTMRAEGNRVGISTNGSRALGFWREAKHHLNYVSLSYHAEFTPLEHFIDVVNEVRSHATTHVNVMVEPDRFEQCLDAAQQVYDRTEEVSLDVQIVLRDFLEPYPYTDEQRRRILEVSGDLGRRAKITRERDTYRGLMKLVYRDGSEELVKAGDLYTRNLHSWRGWSCAIGLELLVVDMKGDIHRSWCGEGERLGNVRDREWSLPTRPHVCGRDWCTGGVSDVMVTKERLPVLQGRALRPDRVAVPPAGRGP